MLLAIHPKLKLNRRVSMLGYFITRTAKSSRSV